ncbi:NAD(P)/FAD-dependent oxidoreductase [Halorubrum sp. JWXQ-INN 858]|uniref:dihydrolipoyl dehydrogenase family protein n=1 Tax=Halorubrum sp. JWXQ-INN 858 TaxID=2690782 RepID=UPI00135AB8B8|nr:NAD(P)/FAD-dependent oxidoreductase [Halorubrum sp. JWXQ-INN 858]MWV65341.1 NAD(P)/FAD-dependent oxidoreductase [Halorubrum sp. JWXQ-INN 858]
MHVVVIGAYGSAGAAVADELAPHVGKRVERLTLVDNGDPGGGLCILEGCMPSKELLSAAAHRFEGRDDGRLTGAPHGLDLERIVAEKNDRTRGWAGHRRDAVHDLAERDGIEFYHEPARFVDDHVVAIGGGPPGADADPVEVVEADYVVIATGSVPNVPTISGYDALPSSSVYTSEDTLHATDFPDSGVVMGFGYVGMEMVPYLAEAGVDVTVIEHDERPLDEADPEFGDALLEIYREEFDVEIRTEVYEESIEAHGDGVRLHLDDESHVDAGAVFQFTGRTPNLGRLGLEHTSLAPEAGWIDATMRPPNDDRTFVVGDVNGREPILHVAKEQGFQAAENVLRHAQGKPAKPYTNVHHHVVFSGAGVYPFARVGHTPRSATEAGHATVVATRQASDDGVFKSKNVPHGLGRLVVDADDGTVLGWQGLHYHADTMAKTFQIAVEMGLDVREIPDRAYHPTLPENLDGLIRECAAGVEDAGSEDRGA